MGLSFTGGHVLVCHFISFFLSFFVSLLFLKAIEKIGSIHNNCDGTSQYSRGGCDCCCSFIKRV